MVAERPPWPSCQSALADGPLEARETLLAVGGMIGRLCDGTGGGLGHGGMTSPHGGTIRFEWQTEDVAKAGGPLCSTREVADPTEDGGMLLVPGRLAGRLGIGDDSLLGGTVGGPSQGASGQMGGPAGAGCSSCSQRGVGGPGMCRVHLRGLHALSNTESQTEGWKGLRSLPVQPFTLFRSPFPQPPLINLRDRRVTTHKPLFHYRMALRSSFLPGVKLACVGPVWCCPMPSNPHSGPHWCPPSLLRTYRTEMHKEAPHKGNG